MNTKNSETKKQRKNKQITNEKITNKQTEKKKQAHEFKKKSLKTNNKIKNNKTLKNIKHKYNGGYFLFPEPVFYGSIIKNVKMNDTIIEQFLKFIIVNYKYFHYSFKVARMSSTNNEYFNKLNRQFKNLYQNLNVKLKFNHEYDMFKQITFYILFRLFYIKVYNKDVDNNLFKQFYKRDENKVGGGNLNDMSLFEYMVTSDKLKYISNDNSSSKTSQFEGFIKLFQNKIINTRNPVIYDRLRYNYLDDITKYLKDFNYLKRIFNYKFQDMDNNSLCYIVIYLITILSYNIQNNKTEKYFYSSEYAINSEEEKLEKIIKIKLFLNYFFNFKIFYLLKNFLNIFNVISMSNISFSPFKLEDKSFLNFKNGSKGINKSISGNSMMDITLVFDIVYTKKNEEEEEEQKGDAIPSAPPYESSSSVEEGEGEEGEGEEEGEEGEETNKQEEETQNTDKDRKYLIQLKFNIRVDVFTNKSIFERVIQSNYYKKKINYQKIVSFKIQDINIIDFKELVEVENKIYYCQYIKNKFINIKFNLLNSFFNDLEILNYLVDESLSIFKKNEKSISSSVPKDTHYLDSEIIQHSNFFSNFKKYTKIELNEIIYKNFITFLNNSDLNNECENFISEYNKNSDSDAGDDNECNTTVHLSELLTRLIGTHTPSSQTGGASVSQSSFTNNLSNESYSNIFSGNTSIPELLVSILKIPVKGLLLKDDVDGTLSRFIDSIINKLIKLFLDKLIIVSKSSEPNTIIRNISDQINSTFVTPTINQVDELFSKYIDNIKKNIESVSKTAGASLTKGSLDVLHEELIKDKKRDEILKILNSLVSSVIENAFKTIVDIFEKYPIMSNLAHKFLQPEMMQVLYKYFNIGK
jgi:hypothetical protein